MKPSDAIQAFDYNGVLGELTGADGASIERIFRQAYVEVQEQLAQARDRARETGSEILVDATRVSGVNRGEVFRVYPEGRVKRELQRFPEAEKQLLTVPAAQKQARPCLSLKQARPLLIRAAYNGLWSPSGTNWQPIRTVEISREEASCLSSTPVDACGLVVLARRRYESILGDFACLCGFEQRSGAEWIDLGIWELVAEETARSHGWSFRRISIEPNRCAQVSEKLAEILVSRMSMLSGSNREACRKLLASMEKGDHYPVSLFLAYELDSLSLDPFSPGGLRPTSFDRLVESRSTQRVASPEGSLSLDHLEDLFGKALGCLNGITSTQLVCPVFERSDELPRHIGQAMQQGLDGSNGIVERANLEHLRDYLCGRTGLGEELTAWTCLQGSDLEARGKELGIPFRLIPAHLEAKLREGGQFKREGDFLVDRRGRPLGPTRLMKLVRLIGSSFGRFFLSFHNTHSLLGVVLSSGQQGIDYQVAGRVAIHMTLLARSRGLVSIIKTGPLEIARGVISGLLARHVTDQDCRDRLERGVLNPVLTFQLGLPLEPDELVSAGKPGEHDGLSERRLDRRAPRAPLSAHYIPNIEDDH